MWTRAKCIFAKQVKCVVLVSLWGVAVESASAAVYVVDQRHGASSDANPGTALMPFKTISRATAVATGGDHIVVKSGVYREEVSFPQSGSPGRPLIVDAQQDVVVFPPTVRHWTGAFNIIGRSDIVIRGFKVRDAYFGFKIDQDAAGTPSRRIVLTNNHTRVTASSGIRVAFAQQVTVERNTVEKANYGGIHEMISVIDTDGFIVRGNHVFNGLWLRDGKPVEGKEGIDVKGSSRNGRVVANRVHDLTRLGIYVDSYAGTLTNVKVTGNTVYRCKQGIAISSEHGGPVSNVLISNNLVYNNINYGIIITNWTGGDSVGDALRKNISIFNNTAFGNGAGGIRIGTRNIEGLDVVNNIVAANKGAQLSALDANAVTQSAANLIWAGPPGNVVLGAVTADPSFVNPSSGDFRLRAASAAIDSGITLDSVPRDVTGVLRPQGAAYDIGAYERVQ